MGMTRKQAKEYVADPKNWKLMEESDTMRMFMLTAGEKDFVKVQIEMLDQFQLICNKIVTTKWSTIGRYGVHHSGWIDGAVSVSEIENAVYEASKNATAD